MTAATPTYGDESWLERFGKWAPLITLALVLVGGVCTGIIAIEGGFQSGNQVEIRELKTQVADVKHDVGEIKKSLEPLPKTIQVIEDHSKQIGDLSDAHAKLRDRVYEDESKYADQLATAKTRLDTLSSMIIKVPRN